MKPFTKLYASPYDIIPPVLQATTSIWVQWNQAFCPAIYAQRGFAQGYSSVSARGTRLGGALWRRPRKGFGWLRIRKRHHDSDSRTRQSYTNTHARTHANATGGRRQGREGGRRTFLAPGRGSPNRLQCTGPGAGGTLNSAYQVRSFVNQGTPYIYIWFEA